MKDDTAGRMESANHISLFILFLICGLLIFVLGSPYYSLFPTNQNTYYNAFLCIVFAAFSSFLYQRERYRKYWQISYAIFMASCANLVLGLGLFRIPGSSIDSLQGRALDGISFFPPVVVSILVLTRLSGENMGSIYMQKGRLKQSLIVGLTVFIVSGVSGIGYRVIQHRSMDTLIVYMPMLLLFCLAVASAEELWFRGIFLRKLEPFLGATRSLILTSIIFAVSRVDATHMSGVEAMRLYSLMFALGLVCGFLMLKTKNLWGSILVHTGPYFFYELCSGSFAIIE